MDGRSLGHWVGGGKVRGLKTYLGLRVSKAKDIRTEILAGRKGSSQGG